MAQVRLGECYEYGYGVTQDYKKAIRLYRMAADKGNPEAQYLLGHCYEYGIGVSKDIDEALRLYHIAAEQDFDEALFELGVCYRDGRGVSKDRSTAYSYFMRVSVADVSYGDIGWKAVAEYECDELYK